MPDPRILVGLDFPTAERADALVSRLRPELCALKVGKELFTAAGPDFVRSVVARGFRVFLDLKFHDIPNTVAQACVAATRLGVWMLDVHASGGRSMMAAARAAVEKEAARQGIARPLLVGVTVLTSLSAAELGEVGVSAPPGEQALRLAVLSQASGLDGVVCSPLEAPAQLLLSIRRPAPAIGGDQALGWEVVTGTDPFVAKDGVTAGQAASIVLDAQKQTGVVVLSNALPVKMKAPPDGGIGAADLARHLIRPALPVG